MLSHPFEKISKCNTLRGKKKNIQKKKIIEDFLFGHPEVIEHKLRIIGRQVNTEIVGIIDLLAEDGLGNIVVIEIKKGKGTDKIVGQVSRYLTWVKSKYNKPVRGIIIVKKTTPKLEYAIRGMKYPVSVKIFGSQIPVSTDIKYCQKCGFSNHNDATYCQKCGKQFGII